MRNTWVKTEATGEPVTATEAKGYCKVTGTGDDALFAILIKAAREEVEKYTGCSLAAKTIITDWDSVPRDGILELPYGPVESITSVKTVDQDGVEATLTLDTEYHVLGAPWSKISIGGIWSTRQLHLKVEYVVGYGGTHTPPLPYPLKVTILKRILTHYDHREDIDNEGGSNVLPNSGFELAAFYRKEIWFA